MAYNSPASIADGVGVGVGAVCEVVAEAGNARVKRIGINDRFSGIGSTPYLMKETGLTEEDITAAVLSFYSGKTV